MQDFKKLGVWSDAHAFVLEVYEASSAFPVEEKFGIKSQLRRAATFTPTNIAEGCGRKGGADFARFLYIAMGSASEVEYLLILAHDLGLLKLSHHSELQSKLLTVKRRLNKLIQRVVAGQSVQYPITNN